MPYTYSNDKSIYYNIAGEGQPLVLLSPIGSDTPIWDNLMSLFCAHFAIVRFDYRGTGLSDKPYDTYTNEAFLEDTIAVLNAANIEKAHLVGHDMGGMIAQHVSHRHPDRLLSLTLASTWHKINITGKDYFQQQLELAKNHPSEVEVIQRQHMIGLPHQPLHAFIRQAKYCLEHDATAFLPSINIPSLVISGSDDEIAPHKINYELTALLPNARSSLIDGAGHMLQLEVPEEFALRTIKFCKSL